MRLPGIVMTVIMTVLFVLGVHSFFVVPPQAKREAAEIEENLRRQQEEAEARRRAQQEEMARRAKEEEERRKQEEYLEAHPWKRFADSSDMAVVGIGDSVMLGAIGELYNMFPNGYFDAVFGRTIFTGKTVTADLGQQDLLGDVVVFSLGTNSYIEQSDIDELISYCGNRPTFWLTTYGVSNDSNEKTRQAIEKYEDAYMIDWESVALEHRGYILADGLHPTPEGAIAYAQLIHDTINECLELSGGSE